MRTYSTAVLQFFFNNSSGVHVVMVPWNDIDREYLGMALSRVLANVCTSRVIVGVPPCMLGLHVRVDRIFLLFSLFCTRCCCSLVCLQSARYFSSSLSSLSTLLLGPPTPEMKLIMEIEPNPNPNHQPPELRF